MKKKALIVGCGELGSALGLKLIEQGYRVTGIRRQADKIPHPIQPLSMDLYQTFPEPGIIKAHPLIYVILTPSARTAEAYENTYGRMLPQLLKHLAQSRSSEESRRLILTSSTHVYPENEGGYIQEESETSAYDYRSAALLKGEQALFKYHSQAGICVRFSGLYRSDSQYLQKQLMGDKPLDNPDAWTNRIHREDAVGFLAHLATHKEPHSIYMGSDNEPVTRRTLFQALGKKFEKAPVFTQTTEDYGKRCVNQRLQDSGYRLKYPNYRAGYGL